MSVGKNRRAQTPCPGRAAARGWPVRFARPFALLAVLGLLFCLLPGLAARAADYTPVSGNVANLVVFVKYHGDGRNVFNIKPGSVPAPTGTYQVDNWENIKQIYQDSPISFASYMSAISEGRLTVTNYFPQELADRTGTNVFELSRASYSGSEKEYASQIVGEVIGALNSGAIPSPAGKLDNRSAGVLDNLTIIVQYDKKDSGTSHAFSTTYDGGETFAGLRVVNCNVITSNYMVEADGSINTQQRQGVVAHEFLHSLGLPDLYRASGSGMPVGLWDVMGGNFHRLQYPLSYFRAQLGWIPMQTVSQSGTYTLSVVSERSGDRVLAIRTPRSDNELICLEYRIKQNGDNDFEYSIYDTGLLMYRINPLAPYKTNHNATGENYVYVYRPGVSDPEKAEDVTPGNSDTTMNLVRNAALHIEEPGASYGSTDLNADFRQNTLYYSDGTNSGIRLSDFSLSEDKKQVTFTVTFADYNADGGQWEKKGDTVSTQSHGGTLYVDPATGAVYAACLEGGEHGTSFPLTVRRWNGSGWEAVNNSISGVSVWGEVNLAACQGQLYLSYMNASGQLVYCRSGSGSWQQIASPAAAYPLNTQFIPAGEALYAAFEESYDQGKRLVLWDVLNGRQMDNTRTSTGGRSPEMCSFSNPSFCFADGRIYALYCNNAGANRAQLDCFDPGTRTWQTLHTFSISGSNVHDLLWHEGRLYAFSALGGSAVMGVYDGGSWSEASLTAADGGSFFNTSLNGVSDQVYLSYYNSKAKAAVTLRGTGAELQEFDRTLSSGESVLVVCGNQNILYAAAQQASFGPLVVRSKQILDAAPLPPAQLLLTLTPPPGYDDAHITIDGVEYEAQKSGGSYTLELPNADGKTAVMYAYNAGGVPVGMYVWRLGYPGRTVTATALPGLQDLLSYHGFSIRVQSPAGIRFKSGIGEATRGQLLDAGIDGCRLVEYGTMFITSANREHYPFILGGAKVGGGRAYWTENGRTTDLVFEKVGGRMRFTSVLINLQPNMYATEIAFRSYCILESGGDRITVYGPPVARSVYAVAKQIQERGEFAAGSAGYLYVQGIIDSVEHS